jgi:hypothetical protein
MGDARRAGIKLETWRAPFYRRLTMCHECPECQQMCYCDGEDVFHEYGADVDNCRHNCDPEDDDGDPYDDYEEDEDYA